MANTKPKTPVKTPAIQPVKPQTPPAAPAAPKAAPAKKASTPKQEKTHAKVAPTPKAEIRRHWDDEDFDVDPGDDDES